MSEMTKAGGEVWVRPPNSIILIDGGASAVIPQSLNGGLVAASASCVAVGTRSEWDASTRIRIRLDDGRSPGFEAVEVFRGAVETPEAKLYVKSVFDDVYLSLEVGAARTTVVVAVDDPHEPAAIDINAASTGDIPAR